MTVHTPDWVKHAVFYQIYPDRFARSPRIEHPRGITFKPWGSPPEEQGFQGGDLYGIVDHLDYLQDLGITALYLNPIFASASNHRYHTYDYFQVDPLLGGNNALRELLDVAHARGMRVVLDGVFNHASRGFWAFHHIAENGADSPYLDWFHINSLPLQPYPPSANHPTNYESWANLPALPKFNTDNPGVRDYIFAVARHWVKFGIDGWRLDVPQEIDDDAFWQEFRQVVKTVNPEAYIVGEIWESAQRWLQGDQFDAVMNYIFSRATMGFFGAETLNTDVRPGGHAFTTFTVDKFAAEIERMHNLYDWEINYAQLNLLDSHDTPRILWQMGGDESAVRLSVLFQMTMPGAPCVYYGDEIGMTGGLEPGCRGAFLWDKPETWNTDLLDFFRRAIALRHNFAALRTGTFQALFAADGVYAFKRTLGKQTLVAVFNANRQPKTVSVPLKTAAGTVFRAVWGNEQSIARKGTLPNVKIPARDAVIFSVG